MRIIFFVNHFFPSVGGVQWSALRTAEALVRRGHQVTVLTETPEDGTSNDRQYPFSVIRFRIPLRRPFTRLGYWRWMWSQRERLNDADVLHFHDYTTFFHWFLPLRLAVRRPCYAVTFHGYEHWPIKLRHRFFRSVTARCCQTRFAVGEYITKLYHHPVDAVYIGAPVRSMKPCARGEEIVVVYAGRFAQDTGILPLLRALERASTIADGDARRSVTLRLAGEGPLRGEIERLAGDRIRMEFVGAVSDTVALYEGARYVVATGFLGIFEAFSSGIPVIVPAFNPLKRLYVESIPGAETLLTILRSEQESERFFRSLTDAGVDTRLHGKAEAAAKFVSQLSWDDIAELCEQWYLPAVSGMPRAASQWQVTNRRIDETHAHG